MPLMGIREYGRHRGVSHVGVLKAIRAGRIRQNPDGSIDSVKADRDWTANTHPAVRAPRAAPAATNDEGGYSAARTVREVYWAKLARLDFEERSATLLDADEVKIAAFQTEQAFRADLMLLPETVASQVAVAADERTVHAILSCAIRAALTKFADRYATSFDCAKEFSVL